MFENNRVFIGVNDFDKWISAGLYLDAEHGMDVEYCLADKEFIFIEGNYPIPMEKCIEYGIRHEIKVIQPELILIFSDDVNFKFNVDRATVTVARTDAPHMHELIDQADLIITTPGTKKINCYSLTDKVIIDLAHCCINVEDRRVYDDEGLLAGIGVVEFYTRYLEKQVAKKLSLSKER